jgi:hypothetical protein
LLRDYSRDFSAQRSAAGLKAITLGKLRQLVFVGGISR